MRRGKSALNQSFRRDNPILHRVIEVDTKALKHGLMSGETLRAPRQQLRLLRAWGLCNSREFSTNRAHSPFLLLTSTV